MAKSEAEARRLFRKKLAGAVSGGNIIYVISKPDQLDLLPDGAVRILISADLDTIKARFRARMHGVLHAPVERMLESKHGMFDGGVYDYRYDGVHGDTAALCEKLRRIDSNTDED